MSLKKFGDWARAGKVLQGLSVKMFPAFKAQMDESGKLILDTMVSHIDAQDLPWVPLAEKTVELKGGDTTIYVETGWLRDNLSVRLIKSNSTDYTIFVGASPWKTTPDGHKFSDLMIWLEYGTDKMPPRPLIRPTWTEVEPMIKSSWSQVLQDLVNAGGIL